jgi:hypothetical protein
MKLVPLIALSFLALSDNATAQEKPKEKQIGTSGFRVALDGGWSYRTAKIDKNAPSGLRDFIQGLKSGYNFAVEGTYFFKSGWGVGLQYSNFRSSNEMEALAYTNSGQPVTGKYRASTAIQYVGPTFGARSVLGKNGNLYLGATLSLGYMHYSQTEQFLSERVSGSKGTFGATTNIFFDVAVAENVMIGVKAAYAAGSFSVGGSQRESLSRIDLSGGVRFRF